jgi:precorrin-6A/cobalt-precorrin-6A reductase
VRVLILGGTREARDLAAALVGRPGFAVTTSLAGRVRDPALPAGEVVIGGFGGVDGLRAFLRDRTIDVVVDATHPFAVTMSEHAVAACAPGPTAAGRTTPTPPPTPPPPPLLRLARPGWTERPGDHWLRVADLAAAAAAVLDLCPPGRTVLVTTGRRDLAPFAADPDRHYVIRAVEPPAVALPPRHTMLLDRGPYTVEGETRLLRAHDVRVLVTKDSGGLLTVAKLDAARALRLPVVMVDRPRPRPVDREEPTATEMTEVDAVVAALLDLAAA